MRWNIVQALGPWRRRRRRRPLCCRNNTALAAARGWVHSCRRQGVEQNLRFVPRRKADSATGCTVPSVQVYKCQPSAHLASSESELSSTRSAFWEFRFTTRRDFEGGFGSFIGNYPSEVAAPKYLPVVSNRVSERANFQSDETDQGFYVIKISRTRRHESAFLRV